MYKSSEKIGFHPTGKPVGFSPLIYNSHHMITQNMLLNQTSKSFNKGTLIYVPKNISKLWIAKKEHSKVIVNGNTCKSAATDYSHRQACGVLALKFCL